MKTYARISISGEIGGAIFYTFRAGERLYLALDQGDDQGLGRESFHPDERLLTPSPQAGRDFDYAGEPIVLDKFSHLPPERAGWIQVC